MNFSDVWERVVPIQTAQGGTVMLTPHACLIVSRHILFEIERVNWDQLQRRHILSRTSNEIYWQGKRWIERDIEWSLMKIQRKQECMQSMMERAVNPNLLRSWVNTRVCIIWKQNNWLRHNLGRCRVTSYGTEGWDIARTEIFEILFITLQD